MMTIEIWNDNHDYGKRRSQGRCFRRMADDPHAGRPGCGMNGEGRPFDRPGCPGRGEAAPFGRRPGIGPRACMKDGRPFPPMFDPDSLMGLWIRSHRALERRPADHRGVRRVLKLLKLDGGSLSQRELTELMGVMPGSLSELLGKMETRGFITRVRDEEDRRKVTVMLTEAGTAKLEAQRPRDIFAALDDSEKEQLKTLLAKLTADWEKAKEAPAKD